MKVRWGNRETYSLLLMPNLCDFSLKVKGHPKDLEIIKSIFLADYSYKDKALDYCTAPYHLFRTWVHDDVKDESVEGSYLSIYGDCAWSVFSCMFEGSSTYYNMFSDYENFKGGTLIKLSKDYQVDIEVYSSECGMCFQEHYVIKNGKLLVEDVVEWFEEYNEDLDEYVSTGGFGKWEFTI